MVGLLLDWKGEGRRRWKGGEGEAKEIEKLKVMSCRVMSCVYLARDSQSTCALINVISIKSKFRFRNQ